MKDLLNEETYSFVSPKDKKFIIAFDAEMDRLGYTSNQTIGDGYCWGRKMIIYTKADVKSKKSFMTLFFACISAVQTSIDRLLNSPPTIFIKPLQVITELASIAII